MRNRTTGIIALAVLGFYYLFRNREQVRQFLDRQGIHIPPTDQLTHTLRDGANKVVERVRNRITPDAEKDIALEQTESLRKIS